MRKIYVFFRQKIVDKERKRKYKVSRVDRFRYRTRYFADAGIIGSKEFVAEAPVKWEEILQGKSLTRSSIVVVRVGPSRLQ